MRQILQLQIGQCGNQIGTQFWNFITQEHQLDQYGLYIGKKDQQCQRLDVYFDQTPQGNYRPRSILTDLQAGTLDSIRAKSIGKLFKPGSFIYGQGGSAGNNYAKGYYTNGNQIIDSIMDSIRRQVENCDKLHGFQLIHSIGGGTGSGLSSLILQKIGDEYESAIKFSYPVFPSFKNSDNIVQPYNAVLACSKLIDFSQGCISLDNEKLTNLCEKNLKILHPKFEDINNLIAHSLSNMTCSFRYPGQLNSDLRKMLVNMVPFNRLHFFSISTMPLNIKQAKKIRTDRVCQISQQIFDPKNSMVSSDHTHGRHLSCCALYRGKVSSSDIQKTIKNLMDTRSQYFIEWIIPNNIQTIMCNIPPKQYEISGSFISNSTSIQQIFKNIQEKYMSLFRRKAFLHWFTNEGLSEEQFNNAQTNVSDLIAQYQQYQDYTEDLSSQWQGP